MKILTIVYHSRTGGTEQMARAAYEAALAEESVEPKLVWAGDATAEDLLISDGFIFAAPENLAALAGLMKEFFDRTYYDVLGKIEGRPYALLVCGGSDGTGAVRQMARICTGWRLKQVAEPIIIITNAQTGETIWAPKTLTAEQLAPCADLGAAFAGGLALGVF